jgi:hypothetical protein
MSDDPTNRGFVLLWRKFWDNPILKDRGVPFSKREAWLYLFSNLANGIDRNGIPRGEFEVSERFLSKTWLWDKSKVHRFIYLLESEGMIKRTYRNDISVNQLTNQLTNHFIICNYETYQTTRTTDRTTDRTKSKEGIKESIKEIENTAETFCTIILKTGTEFPILKTKLEQFKTAYPFVDVEERILRMKSWCINNPTKRKTARGLYGFIDSWLDRDSKDSKAQKTLANLTSGMGLKFE